MLIIPIEHATKLLFTGVVLYLPKSLFMNIAKVTSLYKLKELTTSTGLFLVSDKSIYHVTSEKLSIYELGAALHKKLNEEKVLFNNGLLAIDKNKLRELTE